MMKGLLTSLLAILLAAPAPAASAAAGSIAGRIVAVAGAPQAKAVWVAARDGADVRSVPVAPDGSFLAAGVPAGKVALAVETEKGVYAVDTPVVLAPGTRSRVALALRGRQDSAPPPANEKEKKRKGGTGVWNNPLTASLVVIGAAIVVGVAVDQLTDNGKQTPTASASTPAD